MGQRANEKTKYMILKITGYKFETVCRLVYLGSLVNKTNDTRKKLSGEYKMLTNITMNYRDNSNHDSLHVELRSGYIKHFQDPC
jgi:hypothetical protein